MSESRGLRLAIASYWMQTRGMATPRGDLSAHLTGGQLSTDAWDRQYYRGCFLVSNIAFWFDPVVQDYLQLLFKTGSDIEQRWQDQVMRVASVHSLLFSTFISASPGGAKYDPLALPASRRALYIQEYRYRTWQAVRSHPPILGMSALMGITI